MPTILIYNYIRQREMEDEMENKRQDEFYKKKLKNVVLAED